MHTPSLARQRETPRRAYLELLRNDLAKGTVREGLPARLAGLVVPLREGRQPHLHAPSTPMTPLEQRPLPDTQSRSSTVYNL